MSRKIVKILFELDSRDWHGGGSESLWGEPVAQNNYAFQVDNSPFCIRGISYRDVVKATPTKHTDVYSFLEVLTRGGHSTFMLLIKPDDPRVASYWNLLERIGCSYESGTEHLSIGIRTIYSVDVPPTTSLSDVYQVLEKGEREDVWIYQEGYVHLSN